MNASVLHTGTAGLFADAKLGELTVNLVIDTGSSVTLLSSKAFRQIAQDRIDLSPYRGKLSLADGSDLPVKGVAKALLSFQGVDVWQTVLVADIEADGLLGIDFFKEHECELRYKDGMLIVKDCNVPFREERGRQVSCRVTAASTVVVPPRCEMILEGRVMGRQNRPANAIVESVSSFGRETRLMVGKALIDTTKGSVPLRILNPWEEPIQVLQGTDIALAQPVLRVESVVEESGTAQVVNQVTDGLSGQLSTSVQVFQGPLPEHLQGLLDRSIGELTTDQTSQVRQVIWRYQTVFSSGPSDLGRTDVIKHRIDTGDNRPVKLPPRKIPVHLQDAVFKEIDRLLDLKVIRPSSSPWSSCIVVVRKANGEIRLCLDVRAVNARSKHDSYPLPRVDTCLESMQGSKFFSSLDLANGFLQIEMDEKDRCKTAFSVMGKGFYEFETLPFGLQGGPGTCQRLLEQIMKGLQWVCVIIYMDDLTCYARTFEDALEGLTRVLQRMGEANLKLKTSKCVLFQSSVSFLGHRVSKDGISTDPAKIEKVKEWPAPTNLTETKSFLGLCAYYKNFIPRYGDIARPLNELSRSDVVFEWTDDCQKAFETLKDRLTTAPILAYPDLDAEFILDTDASNYAISGVLSQVQDGKERVIAYGSKTLNDAERNYCTTRRELLAMVYFCPYYKHFLLAKEFTLRTDHAALIWLLRWRQPEGQVARWLEILMAFKFKPVHRAGTKHGNADSLSRTPCKQCGEGADPEAGEYIEDRKAWAKEMLRKLKVTDQKGNRRVTDESASERRDEEGETAVVRAVKSKGPTRGRNSSPQPGPSNRPDDGSETDSADEADQVPENRIPASNWLRGYSSIQINMMQLSDPNIATVLVRLIEERPKPTWDQISHESRAIKKLVAIWDTLRVRDGILFRVFHKSDGFSKILQMVLPSRMKTRVLTSLHDEAGHFGRDKTLANVQERFYWYGHRKDVELWCSRCAKCSSKKPRRNQKRASLQTCVLGAPLERVEIDMSGPWPETPRGNKYILVVCDFFTKYVEAFPLRNQEAKTVADCLVNQFFNRYGMPRIIHSDQGSNFMSRLFKQVCKVLGIRQTRSTPFHARSAGLVERFNRTLETMLSMTVDAHQTDWDENLSLATAAYRATPHASTGLTPNEMMFGREVELPVDLVYGRPKGVRNPSEHIYVAELRDKFEGTHQIARKALSKAAVIQERGYNVNARDSPLAVGSRVWLFRQRKRIGVSEKLVRPWEGPYTIQEVLADRVYKVQLNPRSRSHIVHRDHLVPYQGQNPTPDTDQETESTGESDDQAPDRRQVRTPSASPPRPSPVRSPFAGAVQSSSSSPEAPEPAAYEEVSEVETDISVG